MRVAIVTGASSGIGQSAAVKIAKRGTGVIVTYHGNQSGALDTIATIEKKAQLLGLHPPGGSGGIDGRSAVGADRGSLRGRVGLLLRAGYHRPHPRR